MALIKEKLKSKSKNTKPELFIRSLLYSNGYRYRIHEKNLPGTPDIVFYNKRAIIFVHGCFWHGHNCNHFRLPITRRGYWMQKIGKNIQRDDKNIENLLNSGWRVGVIWECAMYGKNRLEKSFILNSLSEWLENDQRKFEISSLNTKNFIN